MLFKDFAKKLDQIEKTASRNEMIVLVAELLKECGKGDVKPVLYLMMGRVAPKFVAVEFNFAERMMIEALARLAKKDPSTRSARSGRGKEQMKNRSFDWAQDKFKQMGDLGLVAEELGEKSSRLKQIKADASRRARSGKKKMITVVDVFNRLREMALAGGAGSQEEKLRIVVALLRDLDPLSRRYVVRIILGKLRLGLSDKSILDALSWCVAGDKSLRGEIERAYGARCDIGEIAEIVLQKGVKALSKIKVTAGIPVASKLVEREKSVSAVFSRYGKCIAQPKYDGLRCQIHYKSEGFKELKASKGSVSQQKFLKLRDASDKVLLFSRNLESLTHMFPDLIEAVEKLKVKSAILDSEIIGFDVKTGRFLPFQETAQRRRKYGVKAKVEEQPVKAFVFDVLYLDGKDITQEPLEKRLEILKGILGGRGNLLNFSESFAAESEKDLDKFFKKCVDDGLEGIIAKKLGTKYEPGTRNFDWIKLKKTEGGKLIDQLDLVILGYYRGRGVRAKFGIGALLGGVYDKTKDRFLTIAKIGTGIKDDQWNLIKKQLDKIEADGKPKRVKIDKNLHPDVWVKPEIVAVVSADEITKSPIHSSGLALRFPRMVEFGRKDKGAEDATTLREVKEMFKKQRQ